MLGATSLPSVKLQRFPYPDWIHDPFFTTSAGLKIGIFIVAGFTAAAQKIIKTVTLEKERQIKEMMKIMGLPNWLHWTSWFLKEFILQLIIAILITVVLTVRWFPGTKVSTFNASNPFLIFILLLLYCCSIITFSFLISTLFSKANTASIAGSIIFILVLLPFLIVGNKLPMQIVTSFCFNTALCFGFQLIGRYESIGVGVQFNNTWVRASPEDNMTLGIVLLMLIVDAILYMLLSLYFEAVLPGEYGIPQPWYFPCTSTFWCGPKPYKDVKDYDDDYNKVNYEREPTDLNIGIKIKKLRKSFGSKTAVKDISVNMYEDQITVLLGHNGAGKTTTISMLTGVITPTAGTAYINGHNIRTEMWKVRNSLSLCPQNNVLFDELTVEEHLHFFSKLKGVKEVKPEISKYCNLLELVPKVCY